MLSSRLLPTGHLPSFTDGRAGPFPDGEGIEREIQLETVAEVSLMGERRRNQPWGLEGGAAGASGEDWLIRHNGHRERLPGKTTIEVQPGDRLLVLTNGGGGFGPA